MKEKKEQKVFTCFWIINDEVSNVCGIWMGLSEIEVCIRVRYNREGEVI